MLAAMKKTVVLLLLVCLAACETIIPIGPDPTGGSGGSAGAAGAGGDVAGYASGTRLKARSLAGSDGSIQAAGWYDSGRGENCAFHKAGDGQMRCLPELVAVAALWFSDPACTAPAIKILKGAANTAPPPAYVGSLDPTTGQLRVYVTGPSTTAQLFVGNPLACSQAGSPSSNEVAYTTGNELAASNFVAATESHE